MDLTRTHVLVIGCGRTGTSVARCVAERRGRVRVVDPTAENVAKADTRFDGLPIEVVRGGVPARLLDEIDLVVPSPGVPATDAVLTEAVRLHVPVWSEVELAYRLLECPILAVTGTNGKSTTTTLLGEIVRGAGGSPFVGGNLGTPLIEAVGRGYDAAVAEISSFQLEWVERFCPRIGIFLNLSEDHLDRHGTLAGYAAAKRRLFAQQGADDWAIYNRDDPAVRSLCRDLPGCGFSFGWSRLAEDEACGARITNADGTFGLVVRDAGRETRIALDGLRVQGRHNVENAAAAACAALLWGVSVHTVQTRLAEFRGLPHRFEFVACKHGVTYVNDSKGTNVAAVVRSLHSVAGPVILLAGGVEKGGDYAPLRALLRDRVKKLILFGQAQRTLHAALGCTTDTVLVDDLDHAVREASRDAAAGDTVLLSPACASFDQFRDYAQRGDAFRASVEAL